jgi:hypothetical protein
MTRATDVMRWVVGEWRVLGLTGVLFLCLGEAWMRLPFLVPRLEYRPDLELDGSLAPGQRGYIWLGNQSFQSPPVTINRDGHRGADTDWSGRTLLCVGNSDSAGMGVEDDEVWTQVLERALRRQGIDRQVVNASSPGQGPYHHRVMLDRVLAANHVPDGVLVRVSIHDDSFGPVPEEGREARFAQARTRQRIRTYTRFLPHVLDKVRAQVPAILEALTPWVGPPGRRDVAAPEAGERMWTRDGPIWEQMVDACGSRGIPVFFVVHAPRGWASNHVLTERLRTLAASRPAVSVFELGPAVFGLEETPPPDRESAFAHRYTLRRDPHGNAEQQSVIGEAVAAWIAPQLR